MVKLSLSTFRGIAPKVDPELLQVDMAQVAKNARLESGKLKPWYNESQEGQLVNTGTIQGIFLFEDSHWFEWESDVDVVLGPVSADTTGRFYYTSPGIPKKSNRSLATTGAGAKPIDFYPMGMPAPYAALTATPGAGGSGDDRNIQYVWTIVSSWFEEGPPSPALATPAVAKNGQTVALTNLTMIWSAGKSYDVGHWVFPTVSEGGAYVYKCVQAGTSGGAEPVAWGTTVEGDTTDNTVKWRCYKNNLAYKYIYRYNTGSQFGSYQFVSSIAIGVTSYSDTKLDVELAESLSAVSYDAPPDNMRGLSYLGNGILVGFSGKDVCVSEPYKPWAWPVEYRFAVPAAIVALHTIGETAIILTEEGPFLATGTDPRSLSPIPMPIKVACVAKRGAVSRGTIVAFPGPDGLYVISGQGIQNVIEGRISRKDWQDYYAAASHATIYNNQYWLFYSSGGNQGGIVINLLDGDITTLDFYRSASHTHPKTGKLYTVNVTEEEAMPNQVDRDFSGPSAWANVDLSAYNETGDLTVTASDAAQYCTLPVASAPMTVGKRYRLTYDIANLVSTWTIKSFDGTQTIGTVDAAGTGKTIEFTATADGGLQIVAVANDSSGDFDNFSLEDITRYVYEWEGDLAQPRGNYSWKSKAFSLPSKMALNVGRVDFEGQNREAFWALFEAYHAGLARNRALLSALSPGGTLGEEEIGGDIEIGGDGLEELGVEPAYTGDDALQLKIYIDEVLAMTKEIYSQNPFRFVGNKRGRVIEFELIGNVAVSEVVLATSVDELKEEGREEG